MPNRCKKMSTSIIIQPYSAIKFSINLNPNINDNTKIKGKNTIIYNNNSKFVIENTAYIFKGSFEIIQNNIKFEPAFPSLVQKIFIECQNTMELPISLYTAKSTDDRIIASLIIYEIFSEKKTKFLKIVFDPSYGSLLKKYINAINFSKILTYKELYLWKERDKYWNQLRK